MDEQAALILQYRPLVNAELQRKIAELRELNTDMQHFLESTDVGTLFLDRKLCIRKYTPRIASLFHIQAQDEGA